MNESRRRVSWPWVLVSLALLAAVGAIVQRARGRTSEAMCEALTRARVIHVFASEGADVACEGVTVEPLDQAASSRVLGTNDALALLRLLTAKKGSAVAVAPGHENRGVGAAMARYAHVPGLRGVLVDSALAVYRPGREPELTGKEREALAYVARALFRGAREPNASSFPPALRKVERVEVMVSLVERGEARLWRSARGTSIARALLTATRVARDRWRERESAMGGPLRERLSRLDVEVSLLSEDGTLARPGASLIDRAITAVHGVGFDYRNAWHYSLPADVATRGRGSAFRALTALTAEQGLESAVLTESGTRVYRFVVLPLGTSAATSLDAGGASD